MNFNENIKSSNNSHSNDFILKTIDRNCCESKVSDYNNFSFGHLGENSKHKIINNKSDDQKLYHKSLYNNISGNAGLNIQINHSISETVLFKCPCDSANFNQVENIDYEENSSECENKLEEKLFGNCEKCSTRNKINDISCRECYSVNNELQSERPNYTCLNCNEIQRIDETVVLNACKHILCKTCFLNEIKMGNLKCPYYADDDENQSNHCNSFIEVIFIHTLVIFLKH